MQKNVIFGEDFFRPDNSKERRIIPEIDDKYRAKAIEIVNNHFGRGEVRAWNKLVNKIAEGMRESAKLAIWGLD